MFWWFERTGQYLRYEARQHTNGRYELRVVSPDGTEQVETFEDSTGLNDRQQSFERELADKGWNGPHGWNL